MICKTINSVTLTLLLSPILVQAAKGEKQCELTTKQVLANLPAYLREVNPFDSDSNESSTACPVRPRANAIGSSKVRQSCPVQAAAKVCMGESPPDSAHCRNVSVTFSLPKPREGAKVPTSELCSGLPGKQQCESATPGHLTDPPLLVGGKPVCDTCWNHFLIPYENPAAYCIGNVLPGFDPGSRYYPVANNYRFCGNIKSEANNTLCGVCNAVETGDACFTCHAKLQGSNFIERGGYHYCNVACFETCYSCHAQLPGMPLYVGDHRYCRPECVHRRRLVTSNRRCDSPVLLRLLQEIWDAQDK